MSEFCTGCGAAFDEGDRFCAKCGKPRPSAATTNATAPSSATSPASAPDEPVVAPRNKLGLILGAVLGPILIGGILIAVFVGVGESVQGHVTIAGGPRPGFTFTPTGCVSMQPYGHFGANLHGPGPNDGAVYVTIDPTTGKKVEVEIPGSCRDADGTDCTLFPVPRDRCTTYDASVHNTGTVVNDVRLVEGHLKLDCTLEDGTTVKGEITFDGC